MAAAPIVDSRTPAGRLALATRTAHACVALGPEMMLAGDLVVLIMHGADRIARLVAAHVARAAGDPKDDAETPGMSDSLDGRPAPRALVLEMRDALGPALTAALEAPLAAKTMRVLWLAHDDHHVLDVPIDTSHVVEFEKEIANRELLEDTDIDPSLTAPMERDVAGTWQDPSRYLPMPIPKGWHVESHLDRVGVLTVIIDDRVVLDLCAVEMPEKVLFASVRRTMSRGTVTDPEVRRVLDRIRNVRRPFRDMGNDSVIKQIFGDNRVWAALVAESVVTDPPGKA